MIANIQIRFFKLGLQAPYIEPNFSSGQVVVVRIFICLINIAVRDGTCLDCCCGRCRRLLTGRDIFLFRCFRRGRCSDFCWLRFLIGNFLIGGCLLLH